MIDVKKAYKILQEYLPGYTITKAANYKNYWLFCAVQDPNKIDYGDPYWVVDKMNGMVFKFTPAADFDGFIRAISNHTIKDFK